MKAEEPLISFADAL